MATTTSASAPNASAPGSDGKRQSQVKLIPGGTGIPILVPLEIAKMSILIAEMTADDDFDDEESPPEVPITGVDSNILEKILKFCYHYKVDPLPPIHKPLLDTNMEKIMPGWYASYVNTLSDNDLYAVIRAANYLDIPPLLELGCAKVASFVKGKSPEAIRQIFNIKNDISKEEEAQIREKYKWVNPDADTAAAADASKKAKSGKAQDAMEVEMGEEGEEGEE